MLPPGAGTTENKPHLANCLVLSHNHELKGGGHNSFSQGCSWWRWEWKWMKEMEVEMGS